MNISIVFFWRYVDSLKFTHKHTKHIKNKYTHAHRQSLAHTRNHTHAHTYTNRSCNHTLIRKHTPINTHWDGSIYISVILNK